MLVVTFGTLLIGLAFAILFVYFFPHYYSWGERSKGFDIARIILTPAVSLFNVTVFAKAGILAEFWWLVAVGCSLLFLGSTSLAVNKTAKSITKPR